MHILVAQIAKYDCEDIDLLPDSRIAALAQDSEELATNVVVVPYFGNFIREWSVAVITLEGGVESQALDGIVSLLRLVAVIFAIVVDPPDFVIDVLAELLDTCFSVKELDTLRLEIECLVS